MKLLQEYKEKIDNEIKKYLSEEKEKIKDSISLKIFDFLSEFCLRGGKRLRPIMLIKSYSGVKNEEDEEIIKFSLCVEFLESYLLIHDDIIDRDKIRRGGPSFHEMVAKEFGNRHFGLSSAILVGDLLNNLATKVILESNFSQKIKLSALNELILAQNNCYYGELYDVILEKKKNISEDEFFRMVDLKTASYTTQAPIIIGAIAGGIEYSQITLLREYGKLLGRSFQIVDDILGTYGDENKTGKPIDSDIKQGKKTLLVIYSLKYGNENDKKYLNKWIGNNKLTKDEFEEIKRIFIRTGALDKAKNLSKYFIEEANKLLAKINFNSSGKEFFIEFGNYLLSREK